MTRRVRKIATEEAFIIPEVATAMREVVRRGGPSLDLKLWSLMLTAAPADMRAKSTATRARAR